MAGGTVVDLSGPVWEQITRLKDFRDDWAVHPKPDIPYIGKTEMAKVINDFRGLATMLTTLQSRFGEESPSYMIRAENFPEVRVVEDTGPT